MKSGWVYALRSQNSPLIKIGLTTTSPQQRITEINNSLNYGPIGPWLQLDVRQVKDTRSVETTLHRRLRQFKSNDIPTANELFAISTREAREALCAIPDAELLAPVPVNKLELQPDFISYLLALFQNSGLDNFRELQESWTFSLFPSTAGGRYFTLNIDRHEVAFSQPIKGNTSIVFHQIVVDNMVRKDRAVKKWLKQHGGLIRPSVYASDWGNAMVVQFEANFDEALELFAIGGFRRALIAYWYDALLRMRDRGTRSINARHHNYHATSEIFRHLHEVQNFKSVQRHNPSA